MGTDRRFRRVRRVRPFRPFRVRRVRRARRHRPFPLDTQRIPKGYFGIRTFLVGYSRRARRRHFHF